MTHIDLFSGIGGFSLAFDQVFHEQKNTHIFCEIDPFCQAVLRKHWPEAEIHGDIRTFANAKSDGCRDGITKNKWKAATQEYAFGNEAGIRKYDTPFILTGGFPCQPFSQAGRRKGTADDRHLWPEMLRVIRATKPQWVIAENVRGILTIEQGMVFEQVCLDLESAGYQVQPFVIPAVAVNAPHRRDRVWFVAHTRLGRQEIGKEQTAGCEQCDKNAQNPIVQRACGRDDGLEESERERLESQVQALRPDSDAPHPERPRHKGKVNQAGQSARHRGGTQQAGWDKNWLEVATALCTLDDGLPDGLPRPKGWRNAALKACGNSIVPPIAEEIMRAIKLSI